MRYRALWISVISLVVIVVSALLAINVIVFPRITSLAEKRIEEVCSCSFTIGQVQYIPIRGAVVRDVDIQIDRPTPMTVGLSRIRFRVPVTIIASIRRGFRVEADDRQDATHRIANVLSSLARAGVMPRSIRIEDMEAAVSIAGEYQDPVSVQFIDIRHDSALDTVLFDAYGARLPFIQAHISFNYADANALLLIDVDELALTTPNVRSGEAGGTFAVYSTFAGRYRMEGDISLKELSFTLPSVAEEPIEVEKVQYRFGALYDPTAPVLPPFLHSAAENQMYAEDAALIVNGGELSLGDVQAGISWAMRGTGSSTLIQLQVDVPESPVQRLIDSVPVALSGELGRCKIDGLFTYRLNLDIPLNSISELSWRADAGVTDFAVKEIPSSMNAFKLNGEFIHTITDETIDFSRTIRIPRAVPATMDWMVLHSEHSERQILQSRIEDQRITASRSEVTITGNPPLDADIDPDYRYVYVDEMSPWVIRAVLTAEDGDFFFYGGVNWITLIDAIERNIEAGEILYGASTISMQLAKILFLDQKRIFSRKLQEVFLVYLIEHHVPVSKERILELYLNLAEFGPGVFGIYDAALYYFGKHPRDLTAGEATWLASIMPSPKRYHVHFESGRISDGWLARMNGLYSTMVERGRMTEGEREVAIQNPPVFVSRNSP